MTLQERNNKVLNNFADSWLTVLIDHTYNRINVYDTIGLDAERDLGTDYLDWFIDDLFTYIEIDKDELKELSNRYVFY